MVTKDMINEKARELGFGDIGFTTASPFDDHRDILKERAEEYEWVEKAGLGLMAGTDPRTVLPGARSIIVLLEEYFRESFPPSVEPYFGRCYLDDDRVTRDGLSLRVKAFRSFLREHGMDSKVPFNLPHRAAAARAGLGTFGKNCLLYANRAARRSSWVLPVALVVDREFEPDAPTAGVGCPEWCRNACVSACPTGALKGNGRIDPRRCISYLTYYGEGLTPRELREPMGLYVYGCDRCQDVCPRNLAWMGQDLPVNPRVAKKAAYFDLAKLLRMDADYFQTFVWPHMFYMSADGLWRWKMNAARAMGNSLDGRWVGELSRAFEENGDERVKGMAAWALGRIGGPGARSRLEGFLPGSGGVARSEIEAALEASRGTR